MLREVVKHVGRCVARNVDSRGALKRVAPLHHRLSLRTFTSTAALLNSLPPCSSSTLHAPITGAMENWGLVTYREVALLVDPSKSSTRQKSRVALVIAHELAHMWFGNLVTMKWWTDLWLKEGFASFMEYLFVGANYPEFKTWLHFVNDELASGFSLDALKSSHPIEVTIDNPNELDEIYDSITYAKSNSINRMLFSYLGEEVFRNGLRIYLKKFQYNNATTVDLWDALSSSSGQDVNALMSPWTKQMGFPVISVSQRQDGGKRVLKLTQKRFIADGSEDTDDLLWQVPINISTSGDPNEPKFKILFSERETEVDLEGVEPDQWVKLNAATTGYYRVEYSDEMLKALLPAVKSKTLPVLDRFGLANDLFALVKAGRVPATQFLSLLSACSEEDEYTVWATLDGGVGAIANVLNRAGNESLKARFDAFVRKAYAPVAAKLGWDAAKDEDSQVSMLRALIQGRLGKAGDQATIEAARGKFKDHVDNGTELHPDLRMTIYGMVGRNGGMEAYEQLKKMYENATFGEVERHCLLAMSQSPDSAVHKSAFDYAVQQGKVRSQDLMILFVGATVTKQGQDFIWPYFKDNMKMLLDKFGGANNGLFQHVLKISCDGHCTEEVATDVEAFFRTVDDASAQTLDRPIRQITETIRVNGGLLKRNEAPIDQWLTANGF
uniref:Puromycin-sensitive aminopeptidase n=1 Tax=Plectus sambesii TaxID=2011161 RepID=A0A914USM4_9BILA